MAVTQNTYTGDGTTVLFSFTFPYLETTDIKVSLNGVITTAYTLANATTIQFNTAPVNGAAIRIYRVTDDTALAAQFYPGSAIRSTDLNENFTQNLYVTQESNRDATSAISTANSATTTANTALSTANSAVSTANTASTNASTAVNTANTASSTASSAVSTANTASSNATTAINTANSATSTANTALANAATANSTSNSAVTTANTASTNASSAVTTANAALAAASSAVTTANTASTNAANAVTTANTANTTANTATTTANTANSKADQAIAAVSNSINFQLKANVAAIPASPANDTYIEIQDSTGLESFTPLAGKPAGFIGDSGLSVRLRYTSVGSTWNWLNYYANNSDTRYLKLSGGTLTGNITLAGAPSSNLHPATKAYVDGYVNSINGDIASLSSAKLDASTAASTYQTQAGMSSYLTTSAAGSTYAPLASPTFTGTVTIPAGASISGYLTSATAASTYQTQSGMSSYLTTANAASTYQTQAGMSSYLTTATASSTYAPKNSPTFTGTVTIPAGASISGYAALATAQSFTAAQRGTVSALTSAATVTPDFATANNFSLTLGHNLTLANPTNLTAGQSGSIVITQGSGTAYTVAYGSNWKFSGGTPTMSTGLSSVSTLVYYVESASRITAQLLTNVT